MRHDRWRWAALGGLIVIALMYGMELASSGITKIYGPLPPAGAVGDAADAPASSAAGPYGGESGEEFASPPPQREADLDDPVLSNARERRLARELAEPEDREGYLEEPANAGDAIGLVPVLPPRTNEPTVNKLADGASGLLQDVSSGGIRLVVHLFDALTG